MAPCYLLTLTCLFFCARRRASSTLRRYRTDLVASVGPRRPAKRFPSGSYFAVIFRAVVHSSPAAPSVCAFSCSLCFASGGTRGCKVVDRPLRTLCPCVPGGTGPAGLRPSHAVLGSAEFTSHDTVRGYAAAVPPSWNNALTPVRTSAVSRAVRKPRSCSARRLALVTTWWKVKAAAHASRTRTPTRTPLTVSDGYGAGSDAAANAPPRPRRPSSTSPQLADAFFRKLWETR